MIKEDLYLQVNYLKQIAGSLLMFKDKGSYIFNMRCPFCGDSTKSRTKARGYCVRSPLNGLMVYKCHNCGIAKSFLQFLKFVDGGAFKRYWFEVFKNSKGIKDDKVSMEIDTRSGLEKKLDDCNVVSVWKLSRIHPVNVYLKSRMIPKDKTEKFYYTENFKSMCEGLGVVMDVPDDARLVMFETDVFGGVKIIIGRSLDENSSQRYITLKIDDDYPKIYGLSKVKKNDRVYIVEGAIDSMFLNNAVAALDSSIESKVSEGGFVNPVLIFDNEPRSIIIARKLKHAISSGYSVVVFDKYNQHKDINKMVLNGYDNINEYIESRIFKGVRATLEYSKWAKV